MELIISYSAALLVLVLGSITDLKTREVPDMLNYGLILFGISINLLLSVMYWEHTHLTQSLFGLAVMYALACLLFYTGQWGGGDAKMIMGLGALFGLPFAFTSSFLASFLLNVVIAGAFYGLLWSLTLAVIHHRIILNHIKQQLATPTHILIRITLLIIVFSGLTLAYYLPQHRLSLFFLIIIIPVFYYISITIRAVELKAMIKSISPKELTEGDWVAQPVKVRNNVVYQPDKTGIEVKDIKKLRALYNQKKLKAVSVKQGIPFVPSFLIAFLLTLWIGNPLQYLVLFV